MRALFRRSDRNQRPTRPAGPAGNYRSSAYVPLLPWQLRERRFRLVRRGLDPAEVHAFLDRAAGDLDDAYRALRASRAEAARIRDALRRWQSEQAERAAAERR
ncbi:DivIVA domain-containing protein [Micromonospora sp. NPDC000089]|uniref:DivIVA domain-containing protein n=1 Tax=unclassified Micromonospora TaxID=2617518 RepID=UPI0036A85823